MNLVPYGKTMKNIKKGQNLKFVDNEKPLEKEVRKS